MCFTGYLTKYGVTGAATLYPNIVFQCVCDVNNGYIPLKSTTLDGIVLNPT